MRFLILGRIEKKNNQKNHKKSLEIGGLVLQHHCRGAWEQQIDMAEKLLDVIVELRRSFVYAVTMLVFQIKRII